MAVGEPQSCRGCGTWWGNTVCPACIRWEAKYPLGLCTKCRRVVPVQQGLCRGCRVHIHHHGPDAPIQLWFGGVLALGVGGASRALGYTPQGRPGRRRAQQAARPKPQPVSEHLAFPGQLPLFDVERDWSRISIDGPELPSLTPEAASVLEQLTQYARRHSWIESTEKQVGRTLRVLVSWLGAAAPIDERDVGALTRDTSCSCGPRTAAFLDSCGLLVPLPAPVVGPHEAAVRRLVSEAPDDFRSDVDRWVAVLRGEGRLEHRALNWSTIRKYVGYLAPVLTRWTGDYTSLREVTKATITTALKDVTGTTAQDRHVALRSLFSALLQERLIFRDPTRGISMPGHQRPPASLPTGLLSRIFERAEDRLTRVIIVLISVHAMTPTAVRMLELNRVDMSKARIDRGGFPRSYIYMDELTHRVLSDWLSERHERWPRTQNPYLMVSNRSAADYRRPPITETHLHRLLQRLGGVHATQLRIDRVLDEAHESADPVRIMRLFGLSSTTAMNYVATAHPAEGASIRK